MQKRLHGTCLWQSRKQAGSTWHQAGLPDTGAGEKKILKGLRVTSQGFLDAVSACLGKALGRFAPGGININLAAHFPEQVQLAAKAGAVTTH
jgi:hypothetical protein